MVSLTFSSLVAIVFVVVLGLLAPGATAESTVSFNVTSGGLLGYNLCVPLKQGSVPMPSQALAMGISMAVNQSGPVNEPATTAHYYSLFGNSSIGNEYSMVGQINFASVAAAATANVPDLYLAPCFSSTAVPGGACLGPMPLSKFLNSTTIRNFAGRTLLDVKLFFYDSSVNGVLTVVEVNSSTYWLCTIENFSFNALVTFVFQ